MTETPDLRGATYTSPGALLVKAAVDKALANGAEPVVEQPTTAALAAMESRGRKRAAAANPVTVGSIFECSWGYDQTNVDFYKVVGLTPSGKSVRVVKVGSTLDPSTPGDGGGPTTYVVPNPDVEVGPVATKRLTHIPSYNGQKYEWRFKVSSYADAYLWNGKPCYETGGGWGH